MKINATLGKGWLVETTDWLTRVGFELVPAESYDWRLWKHPLLPEGIFQHIDGEHSELVKLASWKLRSADPLLGEMYLARLAS